MDVSELTRFRCILRVLFLGLLFQTAYAQRTSGQGWSVSPILSRFNSQSWTPETASGQTSFTQDNGRRWSTNTLSAQPDQNQRAAGRVSGQTSRRNGQLSSSLTGNSLRTGQRTIRLTNRLNNQNTARTIGTPVTNQVFGGSRQRSVGQTSNIRSGSSAQQRVASVSSNLQNSQNTNNQQIRLLRTQLQQNQRQQRQQQQTQRQQQQNQQLQQQQNQQLQQQQNQQLQQQAGSTGTGSQQLGRTSNTASPNIHLQVPATNLAVQQRPVLQLGQVPSSNIQLQLQAQAYPMLGMPHPLAGQMQGFPGQMSPFGGMPMGHMGMGMGMPFGMGGHFAGAPMSPFGHMQGPMSPWMGMPMSSDMMQEMMYGDTTDPPDPVDPVVRAPALSAPVAVGAAVAKAAGAAVAKAAVAVAAKAAVDQMQQPPTGTQVAAAVIVDSVKKDVIQSASVVDILAEPVVAGASVVANDPVVVSSISSVSADVPVVIAETSVVASAPVVASISAGKPSVPSKDLAALLPHLQQLLRDQLIKMQSGRQFSGPTAGELGVVLPTAEGVTPAPSLTIEPSIDKLKLEPSIVPTTAQTAAVSIDPVVVETPSVGVTHSKHVDLVKELQSPLFLRVIQEIVRKVLQQRQNPSTTTTTTLEPPTTTTDDA